MQIPRALLLSMLLYCVWSPPVYGKDCAPTDAIQAFEFGQEFLQSGYIREGATQVERAVGIYPDFIDAWKLLKQLYTVRGVCAG